MLSRLRNARLLWPTVATLVALAILVTLGAWQWQRRSEKLILIERITQRAKGPPVPAAAARRIHDRSPADIEYASILATGRFLHQHERYLYAPAGAGGGWHVMTPMALDGGGRLWVNRGYVPDMLRDPSRRTEGQVPGVVTVVGLARLDQPASMFTPAGDAVRNVWHRRAVADFDASAFPDDEDRPYPFILEADATENPGGWPKGGVTRLQIPNRHLEYAFTWWGLAATLVGVYAAFAWTRLRTAVRPA